MNIIYGVGSSLGAALGGAMAEALGWRWEFGIQIPPLIICLCISTVAIPDKLGIIGERRSIMQAIREFDAKGSMLLTVAISFLILGLVSFSATVLLQYGRSLTYGGRILVVTLCHVSIRRLGY